MGPLDPGQGYRDLCLAHAAARTQGLSYSPRKVPDSTLTRLAGKLGELAAHSERITANLTTASARKTGKNDRGQGHPKSLDAVWLAEICAARRDSPEGMLKRLKKAGKAIGYVPPHVTTLNAARRALK